MIGLTSEQLYKEFFNNCIKRLYEATGSLDASEAGESPDLAKMVQALQEKNPKMGIEQVLVMLSIGKAFMDCIVQNNEALAKAIPHLDLTDLES